MKQCDIVSFQNKISSEKIRLPKFHAKRFEEKNGGGQALLAVDDCAHI